MPQPVFGLLDGAESWGLTKWWPPAAGLAAGALCTAVLPLAPEALLSPGELRALAVRWTLPVFCAAAAVAYVACRVVGTGTRREAVRRAAGAACGAAWFPALALLMRHNSLGAVAVAAGLAAAAAWALAGDRAALERVLLPSAAMAAAVEAGAFAMAAGNRGAAAALFAVAAAMAAWILNGRVLRAWRRRAGTLRLAGAGALALVFCAGALTPYLERGGTGAGWLLAALFGGPRADEAGEAERAGGEAHIATPTVLGDTYPGVIVWPEVEPHTLLVPPVLATGAPLFGKRSSGSVGVPFSGFYSFRRATRLPPRRSHVTRGDPADMGFRTTDASPMVMEAHQDFGNPIDTACCREIAVVTRIRDPRPSSVRLLLILSDSQAPGQPEEWLGSEPLAETVKFRMPAAPKIRRFDRATVRFRLHPRRWDQSAKVSVRRFVFLR